jgi:flagellar hook-length control protein FliK
MRESVWKDPFMPGAATVVDLLAAKPGASLLAGSALSGGKAAEAGAGFATILKDLVPPQSMAGVGTTVVGTGADVGITKGSLGVGMTTVAAGAGTAKDIVGAGIATGTAGGGVTISAADAGVTIGPPGAGMTTGAAGAGQPTPATLQGVPQQMTDGAPTDASTQPIAAAPVQPLAADDALNVAAPVSPMSKTAAKSPALAVQDVRRRSDQPAAKSGHDAQANPPDAITGLTDPTVAIPPPPPPPPPPAPVIPGAADPAKLPAAAGVVAVDIPLGEALAHAGAVNTAPAASSPPAKQPRGEIAAAPMKATTEQASSAAAPIVPVAAMSDMQASGHAQAVLGGAAALAPSAPLRGAGASAAAPSTPPPAEQVAASISGLGGNASSQTLIVRLNPGELGHVQITIARPNDGPASVSLVAERPETLLLLLRDQPHLNQALDQAGIPSEARTLTFDLATPRTQGAPAGGEQGSSQSSNQPTMDFGATRDERGRQDSQWQGEQSTYRGLASPLDATFALTDAAPARITGMVGLNITA